MRRCIALFELAYFFGEKPNELLYDFGERGRRTQLLISEAVQLSCAGGHVAAPRAKEGLEVAGDAYRRNLHDFVLQRVGAGRLEVPSREDAGVASQPRLRRVVAPRPSHRHPLHIRRHETLASSLHFRLAFRAVGRIVAQDPSRVFSRGVALL